MRVCKLESCGREIKRKGKFEYCSDSCAAAAGVISTRDRRSEIVAENTRPEGQGGPLLCAHKRCNNPVPPNRKKYCSLDCLRAAARFVPREWPCKVCGKLFWQETRKKQHCGNTCASASRNAANRRKRLEEKYGDLIEKRGVLAHGEWSYILVPGSPRTRSQDGANAREGEELLWRKAIAEFAARVPVVSPYTTEAVEAQFFFIVPPPYHDLGRGMPDELIVYLPGGERRIAWDSRSRPERLRLFTPAPDVDNLSKWTLDAMCLDNADTMSDDCVVCVYHAEKYWATEYWCGGAAVAWRLAEDPDPLAAPVGLNPYRLLAPLYVGPRDKFLGDPKWLPDKDVI